jgi:hypothetical protein
MRAWHRTSCRNQHGLNSAISVAEQFRLRSPHLCFTNALQRSSACLQTSLTEAGISEQPFALPHRPSAAADSRGGVNASDLFFRSPSERLLNSVCSELPTGFFWSPARSQSRTRFPNAASGTPRSPSSFRSPLGF